MGLAYSRAEDGLRQAQLDGIAVHFREELADARILVTAQAEMIAHLPPKAREQARAFQRN